VGTGRLQQINLTRTSRNVVLFRVFNISCFRDYFSQFSARKNTKIIASDEGVSEGVTLKQIIRLGIHQYKVERGIQLYRDGVEARNHNIDPEFSEQTIEEELLGWQ